MFMLHKTAKNTLKSKPPPKFFMAVSLSCFDVAPTNEIFRLP